MTVEEAAKYLFVSRAHIRALLASGKLLEVLPENPFGEVEIEVASIEAYRARMDTARRASLDARTEDSNPVGSQELQRPPPEWFLAQDTAAAARWPWCHHKASPILMARGHGERLRRIMVQLFDRHRNHTEVRREATQSFC